MSKSYMDNRRKYIIGKTYFAVINQELKKVKILKVNYGKGVYRKLTYSVVAQIVDTEIVQTIPVDFIFDYEFNARMYLNHHLEKSRKMKERDEIDTTEGLLRYILDNHLRAAKDVNERQFIIKKALALGYDVKDQLGPVIYVNFK